MPLSIKKSIVRGSYSPIVRRTTNGLKKSSTSKIFGTSNKIERDSTQPQIRPSLRRRSLRCKQCGIPLKPTNLNNSNTSICQCQFQRSLPVHSIKLKHSSKTPYCKKSNPTTKKLSEDLDHDWKLLNHPVVIVSWDCRMLAETTAAMKLRKGARIGESNRQIKEEVEEDETSEESSPDFDGTSGSDEEVFQPSKSYTLRKKHKLRSPAQHRRINSSSSDTSSESLPDLDFPIDRRWSVQKKDNATDTKKVEAGSNGITEVRRNSNNTSATMGTTQAKTPRKQSDEKLVSKSPVIKPRSLRSADVSMHDRSDSRGTENNSKSIGVSPHKSTTSRWSSSHSSPERNRNDRHGVNNPSSSSHEPEKSYSLRCLEKKDSVNANTPEAFEEKSNQSPRSSPQLSKPSRRSRGRPRKVPKVEGMDEGKTSGPSTSTESSTPLTRSQRRAARLDVVNFLDKKFVKPSTPDQQVDENVRLLESDKRNNERDGPIFRAQNSVTVKQSHNNRNAIALRAKQSKMMAKSRVWQCNRNNSTLKTFRETKNDQILNVVGKYSSSAPVTISAKDVQPRSMLTLIKGDNTNKNQLKFLPPSKDKPVQATVPTGLVKKPIVYPKAKCELCNMTFTRRFSLTKHYMTIQHRKMVQQSLKSDSAELRALAKSVPVLARPRRDSNSRKSAATTISKRPNIPSSSRELITFVEEDVEQSEFHEDSNNVDDNNSSDSITPEPEMYYMNSEDNYLNTEQPKIEEWKTGKALGRYDFVCDICEEKFTKKLAFTTHVWNHRKDSDFKCEVCEVEFTDAGDYNNHICNAHITDTKFSCEFCSSTFSQEHYIKKHVLSHKRDRNQNLICRVCDRRFPSKNMLQRHFNNKHLQLARSRVKLSFDTVGGLKLLPKKKIPHCVGIEKNNDKNNVPMYADYIGTESKDQMPHIDLEMVGSSLVSRSQGHDVSEDDLIPIIAPEDYRRKIPVESFNRYKVIENSRKKLSMEFTRSGCGNKPRLPLTFGEAGREENHFTCNDCGKRFQTQNALLEHADCLSQAERFSCQICKLRFKFKHQLHRHQLRHYSQTEHFKPHPVAVRKPSFFKHRKIVARKLPRLLPILPNHQELNLDVQNDIETHDPGPENFETPILEPNRKVQVRQNLEDGNHMYNLYSCELCSETFTEKHTLTVHTRFHQKENVFSCSDCDAKCERKSDLDLHFKCHETQQPFFLCYVCFKPFRWKKDMVRHVRKKHPLEKTYRCLYCSERFRKNDELTIHISKRHPEHRSFPCEYCGRRYAQKRYLLVHIQTQHGIEPIAENIVPMSAQREDDDEEDEDEDDEEMFLEDDQLL